MRKNFLFFSFLLSILLFALPLVGQKVAELAKINKPTGIVIGNGNIYISEDTTIYIYDLKTYQYKDKFGKEGEGPGEMKQNPFGGPLLIIPADDRVYITSMGKFSIFDQDGKFLKEYKISPFTGGCYPFGDRFIMISSFRKGENKLVFAVFFADQDLKKDEKPIIITNFEIGQNAGFTFPFTFFFPFPYQDKLYVAPAPEKFNIDVFDAKGKKINTIVKEYKPIRLPKEYRDKTLNWFKTSPAYKNFFNFFKERIKFRDFFPPVNGIVVMNDKIYVFTYVFKDDLRECIIMDLKGQELKRVFLPIERVYGFDFVPKYTLDNDIFFILKEDVEEETWELHKIEL